MKIPATPYREELFTADSLEIIIGVKRNTLATWIARYQSLLAIGIKPARSGSTRRFTLEQIGIFAVMRAAIASKFADAGFEALDLLIDHSADLFAGQFEKRFTVDWNGFADGKACIPQPDYPSYFAGRVYFGSTQMFSIVPSAAPATLLDQSGFPVPSIVIPLDATLINAWERAVNFLYDFPAAEWE